MSVKVDTAINEEFNSKRVWEKLANNLILLKNININRFKCNANAQVNIQSAYEIIWYFLQ